MRLDGERQSIRRVKNPRAIEVTIARAAVSQLVAQARCGIARDVAKGGLAQFCQRVFLMRKPLGLTVRHRHIGRLHQHRVDLHHGVVLWQPATEHEQIFLRLDEVSHVILHRCRIVFQVRVKEGEDGLAQLRRVTVWRQILGQLKLLRHAERGVLMADAMRDIAITRRPPEHILAA